MKSFQIPDFSLRGRRRLKSAPTRGIFGARKCVVIFGTKGDSYLLLNDANLANMPS